jgi:hypothetical protein
MSSANDESSALISAYTEAIASVQSAGSKGKGASTDFTKLDATSTAVSDRVNASIKAMVRLSNPKPDMTVHNETLKKIAGFVTDLKSASTADGFKRLIHRSSNNRQSKQDDFEHLVTSLEESCKNMDEGTVLLRGAQCLYPNTESGSEPEPEPRITLATLEWGKEE